MRKMYSNIHAKYCFNFHKKNHEKQKIKMEKIQEKLERTFYKQEQATEAEIDLPALPL